MKKITGPHVTFAFEGEWHDDGGMARYRAGDFISAITPFLGSEDGEPILFRRDVQTQGGLRACLLAAAKTCRDNKWRRPTLYFACHGTATGLSLSDHRTGNVTKRQLVNFLRQAKFHEPMIAFGACSIGKHHRSTPKRIKVDAPFATELITLEQGNALAVAAYTRDIDWLDSTLADVLLMTAFGDIRPSRSIKSSSLTLRWSDADRTLAKNLGLRAWRRKMYGTGPTCEEFEI